MHLASAECPSAREPFHHPPHSATPTFGLPTNGSGTQRGTASQSRLEALVTRIAAGDRGAEAALVHELGRATYLLLRRLARNRELAEDLYQETFRIVLVNLREGKLKNSRKLAAFVRGTAKNLVRSEWRKQQRRGHHEDITEMALVDDTPGQWDRASLAEDRAHIRRMLGELTSERDRQVLLSHYLEEEEKSVICSRLGIAAGQFNLILFRARRRFRLLIEREHGALLQFPGVTYSLAQGHSAAS